MFFLMKCVSAILSSSIRINLRAGNSFALCPFSTINNVNSCVEINSPCASIVFSPSNPKLPEVNDLIVSKLFFITFNPLFLLSSEVKSSAITCLYFVSSFPISKRAVSLFFWCKYFEISTNEFVVPDMADNTTIFCSPSVINFITALIFSGEPTDVPPNFSTFIVKKSLLN